MRACRGQQRPQRTRIARTEPIVDDPDIDAGPRFRCKCLGEFAPDIVVVDDVALEQDRVLGTADRVEPCWVVLARVEQQAHRIAVDRSEPAARANARSANARYDDPSCSGCGLNTCPDIGVVAGRARPDEDSVFDISAGAHLSWGEAGGGESVHRAKASTNPSHYSKNS